MTTLAPHQQRVVDEKADLDKKATALSQFIGNGSIFPTLDKAEQNRLREQCEVMWQYSEILGARIAAFTGVHAADIDALVNRFLTWPLPDDVCADSCASVQGYPGRGGTNLLTAAQAKAMLQHVLGG